MVSVGRKRGPMTESSGVPDVVIGGAPRSGTTFLCEVLAKHPDICVAAPFIPEPKVCMTEHPAGDAGILERYAALFGRASPSAVKIEKTSYYLENEVARRRLVRLLPRARYVFIVREPVARAYSNWNWSTKNGLETLPFKEAIRLEGKRPSPLPPERDYARPFDYMTRGRYGSMAEAWLRAVSRDRVAFWIFEDIVSAPEVFIPEIMKFIGVEPLPFDRMWTEPTNAAEFEPTDRSRLGGRSASTHRAGGPPLRRYQRS